MTETTKPERRRRREVGLQPVLAWLTAPQALTVSAWEADNIAAAAQIAIPGRGRPRKARNECTCGAKENGNG